MSDAAAPKAVSTEHVAKGVGTTMLARLGAVIELVAQPLYVLADTAVVGHLGTPELAGLAIANTVLATLHAVFIFLAYGTTSAVARLIGAGDHREAAHQAVQGQRGAGKT